VISTATYIGQTVAGRYRIEAIAGEGGMATVFRATDLLLERTVALKCLTDRFAAGSDASERVFAEARAMASLAHPAIVMLYDVFEAAGQRYLVMEYVEGRTLRSLLDAGALPPAQAVALSLPLLDALDVAHRHGVVHGDFKPENVLITPSGHPKLTDFGIARLARDASAMPTTVLGTALYLAPEQLEGAPPSVASDVYASGLVLYEMLSGRLPFDGSSPAAVASQRLVRDPIPLRERVPSLSPALESVVLRALARHPEQRYPSIEALRQDLVRAAGQGERRLAPPLAKTERLTGHEPSSLLAASRPEKHHQWHAVSRPRLRKSRGRAGQWPDGLPRSPASDRPRWETSPPPVAPVGRRRTVARNRRQGGLLLFLLLAVPLTALTILGSLVITRPSLLGLASGGTVAVPPAAGRAAPQTGAVAGRVTGGGKRVVAGAAIEFPDLGTLPGIVTNSDGAYRATDLPAGSGYTMRVSAPGYQPAQMRVDVMAGQTVNKDVDLAPICDDAGKVSGLGSLVVPARKVLDVPLPASAGQGIDLSVAVSQGRSFDPRNLDIRITLLDPNGRTIVSPGRERQYHPSLIVAPATGTYTLRLDNSYSQLTGKNVTATWCLR
jgi:serine/threonine protein kinase